MEKEFVPYELALRMKALGFDKDCFACYTKDKELSLDYSDNRGKGHYFQDCAAPLYQQAFRWFRENYNWTIKVNQVSNNNWSYTLSNFPNDGTYYGELFKAYEEAELSCLEKLIEIVEEK